MTTILRANTELVTVAWLGGVNGLSPSMVSSTLPTDETTWSATGFITVRTSGGAPGTHAPLRSPVVTLDFWAISATSGRPPWFQANYLAELVDAGTRATNAGRDLTLPANYPKARVLTAYLVQEPRRAYGDQGSYAHYVADMSVHWVDLS